MTQLRWSSAEYPDRMVVYVPGVDWDAIPGSDRRLAEALSKHCRVVWLDPPRSVLEVRRTGRPVSEVSEPYPNIVRLSVTAPPGVTRIGIRRIATWQLGRTLARYLDSHPAASSVALVAATTEPVLSALRRPNWKSIYFATDDFVAGASLMGGSAKHLAEARESNLRFADMVLAVTPDLAHALSRGDRSAHWFPNGVELTRFASIGSVAPATDVSLDAPVAGVIGQFNERTDLGCLEAVQEAGISLLLVGPNAYRDRAATERFRDLAVRHGVQWTGAVAPDRLPALLRTISVGLTPYANSLFNRRSYPLKTLEYLAAGLPVVTTSVMPTEGLDLRYVSAVSGPDEFARAVVHVANDPPDSDAVRASVASQSWEHRAAELLALAFGPGAKP